MTPTVDALVAEALPILRSHGVVRAGLFGSQLRGTAGPESDVDLVVEFAKGRSLVDLVALEQSLAETLGRRCDIVTYRSLHPLLRDRILAKEHRILGRGTREVVSATF